ncbi:ribbon-helix-helix domain-containing protein [Asticcacaulis sp. DW145]|jgi:predicted DNA-binding ribbon-helix-helix protein|uniref:Ribbon-helix-helix domain-containing protein n=1 Tax=Asticcacaulis currens TaxID=2984210 RepID=A0ABT5IEU6_9CAUL|nr:ribbon-helix-helix domain-containing protein [Asticcacaulis currens]MDC7694674.1 ribbon-helix-helix domain-containing protein [Asticcacaulis currens]BEV11100.1 ribbon-helix-helix domain-containing protein [Asticcacaulis sp. DW145]
MPGLRKRSVNLAGHATSVALEPEFWAVLETMAKDRRISLAALIAELDTKRGESLLASFCRLSALAFVQQKASGGKKRKGETA